MNSMNEQPTERVANGVGSESASAQSSMRSADASLEATRAIPVRQVVSYSPDQSFSSQPTIASHPVAQAEKTARMSACLLYTSHELVEIRTTNMGSLYQLEYEIRMRKPGLEKRMIDEMRTMNGNLKITLGRAPMAKEVL